MKVILGLMIALCSMTAQANVTSSEEYLLNTYMHQIGQKVQLGTLVNKTSNLLIAKYSFAVQGGSTAAAIKLLTDLKSPYSYATLPNKAIVTNVWLDILTQPLGSGSDTLELTSNAAADLLAATAGGILFTGRKQGAVTTTISTSVKMTADRQVKLQVRPITLGSAPLTAGKFNVYIEYVIGD